MLRVLEVVHAVVVALLALQAPLVEDRLPVSGLRPSGDPGNGAVLRRDPLLVLGPRGDVRHLPGRRDLVAVPVDLHEPAPRGVPGLRPGVGPVAHEEPRLAPAPRVRLGGADGRHAHHPVPPVELELLVRGRLPERGLDDVPSHKLPVLVHPGADVPLVRDHADDPTATARPDGPLRAPDVALQGAGELHAAVLVARALRAGVEPAPGRLEAVLLHVEGNVVVLDDGNVPQQPIVPRHGAHLVVAGPVALVVVVLSPLNPGELLHAVLDARLRQLPWACVNAGGIRIGVHSEARVVPSSGAIPCGPSPQVRCIRQPTIAVVADFPP
mmetsp:Transcript_8450/g.24192  ORF Transcript_8450/g.24192 Transcript_8450/m.24192 type:complete len:326 (-) Transcript_8450:479-1456(-)